MVFFAPDWDSFGFHPFRGAADGFTLIPAGHRELNPHKLGYGAPIIIYIYIWLVVWNMNFIFPFSWEFHHPNWRTHIFQRGRYTTNQISCFFFSTYIVHWGFALPSNSLKDRTSPFSSTSSTQPPHLGRSVWCDGRWFPGGVLNWDAPKSSIFKLGSEVLNHQFVLWLAYFETKPLATSEFEWVRKWGTLIPRDDHRFYHFQTNP